MSKRRFKVGSVQVGGPGLFVIAGPCVIESRAQVLRTADRLAELAAKEEVPLVFKASYDKANRTSVDGFRGPGIDKGLEILAEVKDRTGLPLLTDVHAPEQVAACAQVIDILFEQAAKNGTTLMLITHDPNLAAQCQRQVRVSDGRILAEKPEAPA